MVMGLYERVFFIILLICYLSCVKPICLLMVISAVKARFSNTFGRSQIVLLLLNQMYFFLLRMFFSNIADLLYVTANKSAEKNITKSSFDCSPCNSNPCCVMVGLHFLEIVNLPGSLARRSQCLVVEAVLHSIVMCIPQKSFRANTLTVSTFPYIQILTIKNLEYFIVNSSDSFGPFIVTFDYEL
ncbi:hypothetical protein PHYBLDRAFT_170704 [Phycomyces blakesleeanus NRRL 1555(-)]|uniref:Uncharacterized protein n=1 Tax=Phycomyces blakesleeanus (strain ATCC 8743b / DSM 1359 / FGSC 10004 / NBRC 33097 / NRRL 1555) TaxID=763407 RepID=A0A167LY85_PHYB8|nr:hypothetical protein PHYBLDRAFT_170704 [Phycomyces blakesleeanus NRRL 1555(-)]OAD71339.1 hypothetical protein PHYBLDRAFT_170704 [Phycomyces blakesleeanus NRRL 1555(-)]|eukprot:XP_018289379.1 hypothetical protein PHYBLDRAFT_170704 [Phycomyces blakesleeanus NRRL 1555(-)]